jgi:hypothetical protein
MAMYTRELKAVLAPVRIDLATGPASANVPVLSVVDLLCTTKPSIYTQQPLRHGNSPRKLPCFQDVEKVGGLQ